MILFKTIRWKNFLSTGNVFTEVDMHTNKSTLIVGENGAGKSTILDAISFVLYGKPFRKINKPQLVNSINQKGLIVEIEFETNNKAYTVRRGIKPNVFEILVDGKVVDQSASVGDYQDILEKNILKMNHKSFCQICILGSASFVPFMQLTAAHRREIIEDLLDIEVFTTMNTILKEKISSNKESITIAEYKHKSVEEKIEMGEKYTAALQATAEEQSQILTDKLTEKTTLINELKEQLKSLEEQEKTLNQQLEEAGDVEEKINKCNKLRASLAGKIEVLQEEIEFFTDHNDCPTCKQSIDPSHKHSVSADLQKTLAEYQANLKKLDAAHKKLKKSYAEVTEIKSRIVKLQQDIAVKASVLQGHTNDVALIAKEVKKLKKQSTTVQQGIDSLSMLQEQRKQLIAIREQLSTDKRIFEVAATLLKDSGIKTKIIKQYVPVINKLINKYLSSMDFFVNFELNENFEETIKSRYRDEFSYASFSEGEKSRLDLALLFTWRAIAKLRNSASTNLLILDEVFDGSLDNNGSDELLKILNALTEGNNVFVISHKTDAFLDKFDKVLRFQKQKNFSRIIEV